MGVGSHQTYLHSCWCVQSGRMTPPGPGDASRTLELLRNPPNRPESGTRLLPPQDGDLSGGQVVCRCRSKFSSELCGDRNQKIKAWHHVPAQEHVIWNTMEYLYAYTLTPNMNTIRIQGKYATSGGRVRVLRGTVSASLHTAVRRRRPTTGPTEVFGLFAST